MRKLRRVILHYTATYPEQDLGVDELRRWHVGERGWKDVGYHFVVRLDGTVEKGRPIEQPGAHARNHNADSIGITYVGGLLRDQPGGHDTRTPEQTAAIKQLVRDLRGRFGDLDLIGHRDVGATECPGFDVAASDLHDEPEPIEEPEPEPPIRTEPPALSTRNLGRLREIVRRVREAVRGR